MPASKPNRAGRKYRQCIICKGEVRQAFSRWGDNAICNTCGKLHNWRFNKMGGVYQDCTHTGAINLDEAATRQEI